jgi:hypothetical protein
LVILLLSLVYEWGKGNLEWIMPPQAPVSTDVARTPDFERVGR